METNQVSQEKVVTTSNNSLVDHHRSFKVYYIIYYLLSIIEALLAFRFLLRLLGANASTGFVSIINGITAPLVAPFNGIFPIARESRSVLDPSALVAMVVYGLIFFAIAQLLRILTAHKPEDIQNPL